MRAFSFYSTCMNSLAALFNVSTAAPAPRAVATTDEVRQEMLDLVATCPPDAGASLQRRLRFADAQGLWFMRSELMALLARTRGEVAAREAVTGLSLRFEGLLPASLKARASFLDSGGHSRWGGPPGI
jgi:hypothetical protein